MLKHFLRKMMCSVLLSTTALPALALPKSCGSPSTENTEFCSCFINTAVNTCITEGRQHGIPQSLCHQEMIHQSLTHIANVPGFCQKFVYLIPQGAQGDLCETSILYYRQHCSDQ